MDNIRVAAIQMRAKVGDVASNLSHAESLVREAFRRGAQWVILPEFFTSAGAFAPSMLSAWLPLEGPALELLRKLAREHDGVVGGSFLAKSGQDCFNSFLLVFPNGQYYRHDKDLPTMWENSYYIGGSDDGVLATPAGPVGAALCWELIRSQTVRRLNDRAGFSCMVLARGWCTNENGNSPRSTHSGLRAPRREFPCRRFSPASASPSRRSCANSCVAVAEPASASAT